MSCKLDLTGHVYGRLTVLGHSQRPEHWLCHCSCGAMHEVSGKSVRHKKGARSCGCWHKEIIRKAKGESGFKHLLGSYKLKARKRGLVWELTEDRFRELTQGNCWYCGLAPEMRSILTNPSLSKEGVEHGAYVFSGIDRRDSSVGYTILNCVPCCKQCNRAKSDRDEKEFIEWAQRITKHNRS